MLKHIVGHADKRIFLAEEFARLLHECKTINIGVNDDAKVVGTTGLVGSLHEVGNAREVGNDGFGSVGEVAGRLAVEFHDFNAKFLEQLGNNYAADGVDAVADNAEIRFPDSLDIDESEVQHFLDMILGIILEDDVAERIAFIVGRRLGLRLLACVGLGSDGREVEILSLGNLEHLFTSGLVEELSVAVEQLEGVPLNGVVAGRKDDAAIGLFGSDSNLGGRSGGHADVDDIKAHADEGAADTLIEHLA